MYVVRNLQQMQLFGVLLPESVRALGNNTDIEIGSIDEHSKIG